MTLIEVRDLAKYFSVETSMFFSSEGFVKAVDHISFSIDKNETFGLAGETGSGKTTLGRLILGLLRADSGQTLFNGVDIFDLSNKLRSRSIQIVFQNPLASLNPRKNVMQIVAQPLLLHKICDRNKLEEKIFELLELVKLEPEFVDKYPHELSGGERQRIAIARAISLSPRFIVADEAVSSLDVSVKAQILTLFKDLQKRFNLSMLFITHDLAVLRSIAHRIGIMYLGKIVEIGPVTEVYTSPLHPYTGALLSATPIPNPVSARNRKRIILKGEIPSPINIPSGCRFHTRCIYTKEKCENVEPKMINYEEERLVSCHFPLG